MSPLSPGLDNHRRLAVVQTLAVEQRGPGRLRRDVEARYPSEAVVARRSRGRARRHRGSTRITRRPAIAKPPRGRVVITSRGLPPGGDPSFLCNWVGGDYLPGCPVVLAAFALGMVDERRRQSRHEMASIDDQTGDGQRRIHGAQNEPAGGGRDRELHNEKPAAPRLYSAGTAAPGSALDSVAMRQPMAATRRRRQSRLRRCAAFSRSARHGGNFCGSRAIRPVSITDLRDFDTIDYELRGWPRGGSPPAPRSPPVAGRSLLLKGVLDVSPGVLSSERHSACARSARQSITAR